MREELSSIFEARVTNKAHKFNLVFGVLNENENKIIVADRLARIKARLTTLSRDKMTWSWIRLRSR